MSSCKYGLLIDSQWCTGCHTCETACQMEHGLPVGQYGIKLAEIGPWEYETGEGKKWQYSYLPVPTNQCDACADRREKGKIPTCVHHCQSRCLRFGELSDLKNIFEPEKGMTLIAL